MIVCLTLNNVGEKMYKDYAAYEKFIVDHLCMGTNINKLNNELSHIKDKLQSKCLVSDTTNIDIVCDNINESIKQYEVIILAYALARYQKYNKNFMKPVDPDRKRVSDNICQLIHKYIQCADKIAEGLEPPEARKLIKELHSDVKASLQDVTVLHDKTGNNNTIFGRGNRLRTPTDNYYKSVAEFFPINLYGLVDELSKNENKFLKQQLDISKSQVDNHLGKSENEIGRAEKLQYEHDTQNNKLKINLNELVLENTKLNNQLLQFIMHPVI